MEITHSPILLCSSAEDQHPQNQGKPQDGEGPANAPGRSLCIRPLREKGAVQALTLCSEAGQPVSILVGPPSLPSSLVLNP